MKLVWCQLELSPSPPFWNLSFNSNVSFWSRNCHQWGKIDSPPGGDALVLHSAARPLFCWLLLLLLSPIIISILTIIIMFIPIIIFTIFTMLLQLLLPPHVDIIIIQMIFSMMIMATTTIIITITITIIMLPRWPIAAKPNWTPDEPVTKKWSNLDGFEFFFLNLIQLMTEMSSSNKWRLGSSPKKTEFFGNTS